MPKNFAVETTAELVEKLLQAISNGEEEICLVEDTVAFNSESVLTGKHGEEFTDFGLLVKLTEVARREREAKINSGGGGSEGLDLT